MNAGLTKRQSNALAFIRDYAREHGCSPNLVEITAGLGLRSKSGTHRLVYGLVARGQIVCQPGRARSIQIVPGIRCITSSRVPTPRRNAMFRQGDVLIIPVKSVPKDARAVKPASSRVVLAEGEATGHVHAIHRGAVMFREDGTGSGGRTFLTVGAGGADVVHEEHQTIKLDPGSYEVRRQREYSPEAIRNVAD